MRAIGRRLLAGVLLLALVAACGTSSVPREEARAFLDATFAADPERAGVWLSEQPVEAAANTIAARVSPRDTFTEQEATFMRGREYIVAVFPEPTGSRIELDDYDRMRTRYLPFILPFWGPSPSTYGPRGDRGGGFRGGGPGFGK